MLNWFIIWKRVNKKNRDHIESNCQIDDQTQDPVLNNFVHFQLDSDQIFNFEPPRVVEKSCGHFLHPVNELGRFKELFNVEIADFLFVEFLENFFGFVLIVDILENCTHKLHPLVKIDKSLSFVVKTHKSQKQPFFFSLSVF